MSGRIKPDYGLDAPLVVRNMFILGSAGLLCWLGTKLNRWSGKLLLPIGNESLILDFSGMGLFLGATLTFSACWMVWDSKIGKLHNREKLLDYLTWTGDEQVLDVGCGRGLLLIGAAKRLTNGKATGIDIWQTEDLSGNAQEATAKNVRIEGLEQRVEITTADMRNIPYPDGSFDRVVSRAAIHNLYSAEDRTKAIEEITRVLKPGGKALIEDIRHGNEYAKSFSASKCSSVQHLEPVWLCIFTRIITFGSLNPVTLLVTK
ncbi:class I SAM-dependent methyltransferase [Undibacterium sp. Ji67W]|uniref:class I SAM-dependent methyltransferase n=1 Tax=Undibacterium sp. Ji67W TaxID=3413042 RepID=UPI003BF0827C